MITLVSIVLYAGSVIFAAITGVTAEQHSKGRSDKSAGLFALAFMVALFGMAVCLQVSA